MASDLAVDIAWQPLTPGERRTLLALARDAIGTALQGAPLPAVASPSPALLRPTAAFVSLHIGATLRGCVGTVTADRPLYIAVAETARSAAFDDPRFPPLNDAELRATSIEISRLGPLVPVRPEQVEPGLHGVCIRFNEHRGLFLPQVATRYQWDRVTLLDELCLKAMLPPDAWRSPAAELLVFEAEVFEEQ